MNFTKRCIIHETASSLTSSLSSTRPVYVFVMPGLGVLLESRATKCGPAHHETQHKLVNELFGCDSPLLGVSKWWLVVDELNNMPLVLPLLNKSAYNSCNSMTLCCRYIAPLSRQVVLTVLQEILKSYRTVRLDFLAEVCTYTVS